MSHSLWGSDERPPPSVDDYIKALRIVRTDTQRKMLIANFDAPAHTITAGEMAEIVFNTKQHSPANVHYGTLAKDMARAVDIDIANDEQAVNFLVAFGQSETGGWVWTLHPNLAEALRRVKL